MILEEQVAIIEKLDEKLITILKSKGKDYGNEDTLSNFKRMSQIVNTLNLDLKKPIGCALFMTLMKIDRIANLISKDGDPENESLEDSFIDLIGYAKLTYCLNKENN